MSQLALASVHSAAEPKSHPHCACQMQATMLVLCWHRGSYSDTPLSYPQIRQAPDSFSSSVDDRYVMLCAADCTSEPSRAVLTDGCAGLLMCALTLPCIRQHWHAPRPTSRWGECNVDASSSYKTLPVAGGASQLPGMLSGIA